LDTAVVSRTILVAAEIRCRISAKNHEQRDTIAIIVDLGLVSCISLGRKTMRKTMTVWLRDG